jgi:hypothetical protein
MAGSLFWLERIVDVFFWLDILVSFRTAFFYRGVYCRTNRSLFCICKLGCPTVPQPVALGRCRLV